MSAMPWGTMNGWLRVEAEQRGRWQQLRVQDLRAAQVSGRPVTVQAPPTPIGAHREPVTAIECAEPAALGRAEAA
jgi:hypothetical protein